MQVAIYNDDLVRLPEPGDTELADVPPALDGWPLEYLRWDGVELVALQQLGERDYHVGADGALRLVAGDGRQALVCAYDDVLLRDGDTWRVETDEDRAAGQRLIDYPALTAAQFEGALVLLDIDAAAIEPAIRQALAGDPVAMAASVGRWRRLVTITRDNPILDQLMPIFGKTPDDIDAVWPIAKAL